MVKKFGISKVIVGFGIKFKLRLIFKLYEPFVKETRNIKNKRAFESLQQIKRGIKIELLKAFGEKENETKFHFGVNQNFAKQINFIFGRDKKFHINRGAIQFQFQTLYIY